MIDKEKHPVGWALLMYELEDAHEHLGNLIRKMASDPAYGEGNFQVDLGHVYAHLNMAWHRRNTEEDLSDEELEIADRFPADLKPL
ncbi:hypothetical protein ACFFGH_32305 [Lysobacter korlensis]|uniref:Uncharacterized protein n=1 Tax=Lysobacter korlensis TaxID=553636 RepID=A0ABV6S345_9GAMM